MKTKQWQRKFFYHLTVAAIEEHSTDILKRHIEKEKEFPEIKKTLQAICEIYSADPDDIYCNAQNRLKNGAYKSEAEKIALEVLFQAAEKYVNKATEAVK